MERIDRGHLGTMPKATERDDESYLDFVEGARVFTLTQVVPAAKKKMQAIVQEHEVAHGPIRTIDEARDLLDPAPMVATRNRFARSVQEMMWQGVIDTYRKREPELLAELARYDMLGPGSVEYTPGMALPDYFTTVEFHIQPGNYHADPLAGYIYHYGSKVFFTGANNNDDVQRALVHRIPIPTDGKVNRILDLACSIGQSSTAFKERFPNAEVWGIDAGAPMVRYAHKRAVDMGLEVHFAQRLAEDTQMPSNSFDLVYAYILFHEVPLDVADRIVAEAYRVLRPGGRFVVVDFPNFPKGVSSVYEDYHRDFDNKNNGEPYSSDFVYNNFEETLRRGGFRIVTGNATPDQWTPMRVAEK